MQRFKWVEKLEIRYINAVNLPLCHLTNALVLGRCAHHSIPQIIIYNPSCGVHGVSNCSKKCKAYQFVHSTIELKTVTCLHYLIVEADEHRRASCSYVKLWGFSTGTSAAPSQTEPRQFAFLSLLQVEPILHPSMKSQDCGQPMMTPFSTSNVLRVSNHDLKEIRFSASLFVRDICCTLCIKLLLVKTFPYFAA